ncbi:MAG: hypothetical protein ACRC67_01350 [Inquilinus sp.]|uniref:hypothetical protein n=1 Tax=Inquilinus sp. TaxID=1932117 RepID=UPI003F3744D5
MSNLWDAVCHSVWAATVVTVAIVGAGAVERTFASLAEQEAPDTGAVAAAPAASGLAAAPGPIAAAVQIPNVPPATKPTPEEMFSLATSLAGTRIGTGAAGPRGVVFYDPRCPYCHAAWQALRGRDLDLLWVPVPALGSEPAERSRIAAALQNTTGGKASLEAGFEKEAAAAMTPELEAKAQENGAVFMVLARSFPSEIEGVPAFVMRDESGGVRIGSGWPATPGVVPQ